MLIILNNLKIDRDREVINRINNLLVNFKNNNRFLSYLIGSIFRYFQDLTGAPDARAGGYII